MRQLKIYKYKRIIVANLEKYNFVLLNLQKCSPTEFYIERYRRIREMHRCKTKKNIAMATGSFSTKILKTPYSLNLQSATLLNLACSVAKLTERRFLGLINVCNLSVPLFNTTSTTSTTISAHARLHSELR